MHNYNIDVKDKKKRKVWITQFPFPFPFPRLIQTKAGCRVLETGRLCEKNFVMDSSRSALSPSFFIFNPPNFIRINFSRARIHYSIFSTKEVLPGFGDGSRLRPNFLTNIVSLENGSALVVQRDDRRERTVLTRTVLVRLSFHLQHYNNYNSYDISLSLLFYFFMLYSLY